MDIKNGEAQLFEIIIILGGLAGIFSGVRGILRKELYIKNILFKEPFHMSQIATLTASMVLVIGGIATFYSGLTALFGQADSFKISLVGITIMASSGIIGVLVEKFWGDSI